MAHLLLLSALFFSSELRPVPLLAGEGFRIVDHGGAVVAVSPGVDPDKRGAFLYDLYVNSLQEAQQRLSLDLTPKPLLVECLLRSTFVRVLELFGVESEAEHAVAIALPQAEIIVIDNTKLVPAGGPVRDRVLTHEITHLLLEMRFQRIPRWLNEGLAMYAASQAPAPAEARRLQYWASRKGVIPFSDLCRRFPREHSLMYFAYIQSYEVVSYLIRYRGGVEPLKRLLSLQKKRGLRTAWNEVYGEEPEATWEKWRRYEAARLNLLHFILGEIPLFTYVVLLFLLAYGRYRWKRRRFYRLEELEDDHAAPRREYLIDH